MSVNKISTWILYLLVAASVVSAVVFYGIGFDDKNPQNADQLLILAAVFVGLGLGVTLLLSLVNFFKKLIAEPKSALKALIGPLLIIAIFVVAYAMADGTIMNITGYSGPDNVPSMLKFSDMMLYTMYAMIVGSIVMVLASSIYKLFK